MGKHDELTLKRDQETETKVVWPHPKIVWLSKDYSAGHSAMKKTEKKGEKKWEDNIKEWIGIDFATSTRPLKTGLGGMGML